MKQLPRLKYSGGVDYDQPHPSPMNHHYDLPTTLVYNAHGSDVKTVIVNGRVVLRGGRSTRVDEGEVYAAARRSVAERMRRLGLAPAGPWPAIRARAAPGEG